MDANAPTILALTSASAALVKPIRFSADDRLFLSYDETHDNRGQFAAKICACDPVHRNEISSHWNASTNATKVFPNRIPERQIAQQREFDWIFGATDLTCGIIHALWPKDQVLFADELTRAMYDYFVAKNLIGYRAAEIVANYKVSHELPLERTLTVEWLPTPAGYVHPHLEIRDDFKITVSESQQFPLAAYQKIASYCSRLNNEGYSLFMEQGTGKTACTISRVCDEAIAHRQKCDRMFRVLIVAPRSVRLNWQSEFENFATCEGRVTVLRGGEIERIKDLISALGNPNGNQYTVVVVSYEVMVRMLESLKQVEWDLVVLDESQYVKDPRTKRCRAAWAIRDVCPRRMLLTGTPVGNSIIDLYAQLEFLGKGESGFTSFASFKRFYGVYDDFGGDNGAKLVAIQNLPFMHERLARKAFIITKKEALPELPEKLYDVLECYMTAEQTDVYNNLRDKLVVEIESTINNADGSMPESVMANHLLTKLLRLAQVTSGFVPLDRPIDEETGLEIGEKKIKIFTPNAKLDVLCEDLLQRTANEKSIIWACFTHDIHAISARLEAMGRPHRLLFGSVGDAARQEAIHAFNADRSVREIIVNPAAGGTGLNLLGYPPNAPEGYDTNCSQQYWYSQNWSYLTRAQAEDRSHRRGTRVNQRITDLCVPSTIDEEIRARVLKKKIDAWNIADIRKVLQAIVKGVRHD